MTAGVAMLSLYAWLVSLRQLLAKHGRGAVPATLAVVTDRARGAREQVRASRVLDGEEEEEAGRSYDHPIRSPAGDVRCD